jgi:hypothetical protein
MKLISLEESPSARNERRTSETIAKSTSFVNSKSQKRGEKLFVNSH